MHVRQPGAKLIQHKYDVWGSCLRNVRPLAKRQKVLFARLNRKYTVPLRTSEGINLEKRIYHNVLH